MRMSDTLRDYLTIAACFFIAFILAVLPFPEWAERFRPDWVGLVLIYWCIATPTKVTVGIGWFVGLILDVLLDSPLLGQLALTYALLAFLAVKLHLRMRMYPRWQQAVVILILLIVIQFIIIWLRIMLSQPAKFTNFWVSVLISMLMWPWMFVLLRNIRRRMGIR